MGGKPQRRHRGFDAPNGAGLFEVVEPFGSQPLHRFRAAIGQGLLGKSVGDICEVIVPAGTLKLEILKIER